MRRTGGVSVFWNTSIYQIHLELLWQTTGRVSSYFHHSQLSLLSVAGFSVLPTVSCDEDVQEANEDEVEALVDRPGTTNGT